MIKSSIQHLKRVIYLVVLFLMFSEKTLYASDGEYITITVYAEDDSDDLMYALDSTDPNAFSNSNTFTIPSGTSHIIYVKDRAGNITSQEYTPKSNILETNTAETIISEETEDIEIETENMETEDIEIKDADFDIDVNDQDFDYSSIFDAESIEPPESGMGTTYDKIKTDGSDDGEKVFYTVTTVEGDTFYMIIDQTQGTDNVYLLNTVTRSDLQALAIDDTEQTEKKEKEEDNLLSALQKENSTIDDTYQTQQTKSKGLSPQIIVIIAVLIGGGVYYYVKVYKNKKDQQMDVMDAMDMEDFSSEENEEEEEFEFADDEKQKFLNDLINGDEEELLDVDPNSIVSPVVDFEMEYDPELDGEEA